MFRDKSSWFSSSVRKEYVDFWILEGGTVAHWRKADYLFSEDAACPDTQRIFESKDFLWNKVTVFHSLFLSTCEKRQSVKSVCIGHYVLPPVSVQDEVRNVAGGLIWECADEESEEEESEKSSSASAGDECREEDISSIESEVFDTNTPEEDVHRCDCSQNRPHGSTATVSINMDNLQKYSGHLCDFHSGCFRCARCQAVCDCSQHT